MTRVRGSVARFRYRERMRQYIKSICRYLSDDDIFDVYQQSLREFIRCVQKPDFDPHKPLRLIQRIIKSRTIDLARRRKGSPHPQRG